MCSSQPAAKPANILANRPYIRADIECNDYGFVRMRYNEHLDCWCVYGQTVLCFPLSENDNVEKLKSYVKGGFEFDDEDCPFSFTVIDVSDDKFSQLYDDPSIIRELTIASSFYRLNNGKHCIVVTFRMVTAYTPYDEDEYMHVGQWFEDCARHMIDKVAGELIARADVDGTNMITSRSFINMDRSECRYMRYAECKSDEVQRIAATIGVWEQPDFWVGEITATVTLDDSSELKSAYDSLQDDIVLQVWGLPVCFTKTSGCSYGKEFMENPEPLRSLFGMPFYERVPQSNSFILSNDKSASFVSHIEQQLMETAVRSTSDQLYSNMDILVIQIVEQLKQHIRGLF